MENSSIQSDTPSAWGAVRDLWVSDQIIKVKIFYLNEGGAITFVKGLRAFIPCQCLFQTRLSEKEKKKYVGRIVTVRVKEVNEEKKQLILCRCQKNAEKETAKRLSSIAIGQVRMGVVEELKDYGAFIDLGKKNLKGFLHISQIGGWSDTPQDVLKIGQTIKVEVIGKGYGRLLLSSKNLDRPNKRQKFLRSR